MAEIIETNERTLDGEIHTHWDKKKVCDTQTDLHDVDIDDQIEIGSGILKRI